mgnify:CR=1 FL=1
MSDSCQVSLSVFFHQDTTMSKQINQLKNSQKNDLTKTPLGFFMTTHGSEPSELAKKINEIKKRTNSYSAIYDLCLGKTKSPRKETLKLISQILECDLEELRLAVKESRKYHLNLKKTQGVLSSEESEELELLKLYIDRRMDKLLTISNTHNDAEQVIKAVSSPKTIPPQNKYNGGLSSCISLERGFKNVLYNHICGQGDNTNKNFLKNPSISLNSKNFNYSRSKELIVTQNSSAIRPGQNNVEGVNGNTLDLDDEERCGFKILSLLVIARYDKDMSFRWRKIYRIMFLKDGVSKIKNLDFFEVQGEPVQIFYQKDKFLLVPKVGIMTTSDVLTVKLHEPSRIGQIIDIVIDFFCPKLYGSDNTFGGTWLRFPIPWLGLDIAPPYPGINKITEVLQFSNLEDYQKFREPNNLDRLSLNPLTNSFQAVYSNLEASLLMLPWERCAA